MSRGRLDVSVVLLHHNAGILVLYSNKREVNTKTCFTKIAIDWKIEQVNLNYNFHSASVLLPSCIKRLSFFLLVLCLFVLVVCVFFLLVEDCSYLGERTRPTLALNVRIFLRAPLFGYVSLVIWMSTSHLLKIKIKITPNIQLYRYIPTISMSSSLDVSFLSYQWEWSIH